MGRVRIAGVDENTSVHAIATPVAACLYGDLLTNEPLEPDGGARFDRALVLFARELGEEPESTKMREDLTELGRVAFAEHWATCRRLIEQTSRQAMTELLHGAFASAVQEGFSRRARRTGQA